jgi:protein CMS1
MDAGSFASPRECLSIRLTVLGALQIDRLERMVVDASHIDQKKRGILDMKETQVPLVVWLGQQEFREKYAIKSGNIQLLFY